MLPWLRGSVDVPAKAETRLDAEMECASASEQSEVAL